MRMYPWLPSPKSNVRIKAGMVSRMDHGDVDVAGECLLSQASVGEGFPWRLGMCLESPGIEDVLRKSRCKSHDDAEDLH